MESFRDCGWPAFVMLLLAFVGLVVGIVALVLAVAHKRRAAIVVGAIGLVLALGTLLGGPLGAAYDRRFVDAAGSAISVDAEQREKIRAIGYAEAGRCVPVGLSLGALPALISVAALGVALMSARQ